MVAMNQFARTQLFTKVMSKDDDSNVDLSGSGEAFRRLRMQQGRVEAQPKDVVGEYLEEIMRLLRAEPGDAWQPWRWSQHIQWGRFKGLYRARCLTSQALALFSRG